MNYELLQDAVVTRLQPFTTANIQVVRLPESEGEKTQTLPTKTKFTVIYAGSEYGIVNATGQVSQDEKIFIQILIESSFLYGPLGVHNLASLLKLSLTGFKAQGTRGFQVVKHHMIGEPDAAKVNNMWNYNVIFQTTAPHVEYFEEDLSVLLRTITFHDGDEIFIVPPVE